MAGSVVARAWVQILPEMDGIQSEISDELKDVDRQSSSAGKSSGSGFAASFRGALGALGGIVAAAGITELVSQAAEAQSQMSRLSASAQANGVGATSMQAAYSGLVGVLGDTDRAVETSGNLFALCGDNQAQLESLTTSLTGAFSQFGDGLPIESLAEAANETARTGTVVGGMADALNWVNASSAQWSAALSGNSAAQAAFNAQIDAGATKEDAFNAALAACSTEQERAQLVTSTLNALYGEAGAQYQQNNADLIAYNQSQAQLSASMATLGTALMPVVSGIASLAATIVTTLSPVLTQIVSAVMAYMPQVQSIVQTALTTIQTVWNVVWPALSAVLSPILSAISALVQGAMTVIQGVINVVLGFISGDWSQVWMGIQQVAQGIWDGITGLVSGAINAVSSVISGVLGTISSVWNGIWSSVSSFVSDTWTKVTTAVSNGVQSVLDFVGSIPDKIMSFFSDAGSWLLDAGKSIIQGLIDGITGMINGAVSAVTGVVDTIRSFFPFSPAKRGPFSGHGYTTWSGRALMEDWGKGMESGATGAVDYAAEAADKVRSALSVRAGVGIGHATIDDAPASSTTNVYIDGSLVAVDSRIAQALALLLDAAGRRRDMGGVTA